MTRTAYIAEIRFQLDPEDYDSDPADWDFKTLMSTLAAQWPHELKGSVDYVITDPNVTSTEQALINRGWITKDGLWWPPEEPPRITPNGLSFSNAIAWELHRNGSDRSSRRAG